MDRQRRKSFSEVNKWIRKEGKSFQAGRNPYTKKQWRDKNVRIWLVNVQELRMNLETANEVEGIESRIMFE